MSHIIPRGHWNNDIVLDVHAPTEDKIEDMKERFYKKLEHVLVKFPKYYMKILLGDLNAEVGREDIFKQTTANESLHEISNDNGVRVVILPHPKILLSKIPCSHVVTFINLLGYLLMERCTTKLTTF
jgi:hypothetical protein